MSESLDLTGNKVRTLSSRLKLEIINDKECILHVFPLKGTKNKLPIQIRIANEFEKCDRIGIVRKIFFNALFYKIEDISLKNRLYLLVALRAPMGNKVVYTTKVSGEKFDVLLNNDYLHISKHKTHSQLYGNYYTRFYKAHLERISGNA